VDFGDIELFGDLWSSDFSLDDLLFDSCGLCSDFSLSYTYLYHEAQETILQWQMDGIARRWSKFLRFENSAELRSSHKTCRNTWTPKYVLVIIYYVIIGETIRRAAGDQRSTQINYVDIHKRQSQNDVRLCEMSVLTFETLRRQLLRRMGRQAGVYHYTTASIYSTTTSLLSRQSAVNDRQS